MSIIILHIPHTGGRCLRRYFYMNALQIQMPHNQESLNTLNVTTDSKIYFILRNPLERTIKEFMHYSRNLKNIKKVNHLDLNVIKINNPNFNVDSIKDYFSLEVNNNPYIKFILQKKDFSEKITEKDLNEAIIKVKDYYYDIFNTEGTKYTNLEKLMNKNDITDSVRNINNKILKMDSINISEDDLSIIKISQYYDIKLYEYCSQV